MSCVWLRLVPRSFAQRFLPRICHEFLFRAGRKSETRKALPPFFLSFERAAVQSRSMALWMLLWACGRMPRLRKGCSAGQPRRLEYQRQSDVARARNRARSDANRRGFRAFLVRGGCRRSPSFRRSAVTPLVLRRHNFLSLVEGVCHAVTPQVEVQRVLTNFIRLYPKDSRCA